MNRFVSSTRLPRALYSADQVRAIDRYAIEQADIPGAELMQRAASVVLNVILQRWPQARRLLVVCGTGNNGGDGYLVAALAGMQGLSVRVLEPGAVERLSGDALSARQRVLAQGISCEPLPAVDTGNIELWDGHGDTVVVDALLGIGMRGELRPEYRDAINWINATGVPVVAVDIPSGLNSDTGVAAEVVVCAAVTVCFIGLKQGLLTADGPDCAGEIVFHDLALPDMVLQSESVRAVSATRIDVHSVAKLLPLRRPSTHKGDCGHVLVVGGDVGYGGAALMAAEAAARSGAGTVSLLTRAAHVTAMLSRRPEIMVRAIEAPDGDDAEVVVRMIARASVVVIGPGLGRSAWSAAMLRLVLQEAGQRIPLVVDADALNLLAEKRAQLNELASGSGRSNAPASASGLRHQNWVLTPHPGEAARLLGWSNEQVKADRFAAVRRLQELWGGACLLKGAGSLLCFEAPGVEGAAPHIELCTEGNPGMATGGMGDVLSGMIGAFIAQGLSLADSLRCAVCVHGESADLAAAAAGERGMLATDLLQYIRQLVNNSQ
ncbi:MAG: NAD(P)H-hydrate dehydratase [Gammaproteobacteria bacterium]|nr:NAD(P)H-hydrate dehydratase [Gammaproteobacteria bacterium]